MFDQEGGKDVADLTPLIEFLAFINESDDATFAAELPNASTSTRSPRTSR